MPESSPGRRPLAELEAASLRRLQAETTEQLADGDALDRAVRRLLRVRGREETERTVAQLLQDVTGARWVAFYAPEERFHRCRASTPGDILFPPISNELVRAVVGLRRAPWVCGPSTALRAYCPPDIQAVAPVECESGEVFLALLGPPMPTGVFQPADLQRLGRVVPWCAAALDAAREFDELRSQIFTDSLTGCFNRRGFDEHLEVEWVRARRYQRRFALMLMDVDRFKPVNDVLGHQAGDYVLQQIGQVLRTTFRVTDRICRFGGDEFGVIFPETVKDDVVTLANRLRLRIAALFPDVRLPAELTVSLGVAAFPDDASEPEALMLEADRALYRAKAAGGNQVVAA